MKVQTIVFTLLLLFSSARAKAADNTGKNLTGDEKAVFSLLRTEMKRSMDELKKKGSIAPYFIAYTLAQNNIVNITSSYGALYGTTPFTLSKLIVEVRVGDYDYDNTDINAPMGKLVSAFVSVDGDMEALKRDIWYQTNEAYEYAVKFYYFKKQKSSDKFDKGKGVPDFSREKPSVFYDDSEPYRFNVPEMEKLLKGATSVFKKFPEIQMDLTRANFGSERSFFINSEGTEILTKASLMNISVDASAQAEDGSDVQNSAGIFYNLKYEPLDLGKTKAEIEKLAGDLSALKKSQQISPGTGPAIFSPQAAGVLFHEAVGHRLEGERQENDEEGQTFRKSVGKQIVPSFISIYDDPALEKFGDVYLNGHYQYDEQGVPSERVNLVEEGVLKGFLMSRTPIENFSLSNGHGRSYDDFVPVARMSNLFVKSSKEVSAGKLKSELLKECKRQKKNYGYIIETMMGGETETAVGRFQVYKSVPLMVYRVDAETGRSELVRGVEIVGTPLASVNKILMTGDDYSVKNGFCGAESGWIRVSTIAPSILLSEIELQNRKQMRKQLPIISRPD